MTPHYARDQAGFASAGPTVPGIAQILSLLSGDEEHMKELLGKILGNRKQFKESAREQERRARTIGKSVSSGALKCDRL
ncbi:hypothetical protein GX441_01520 [bacterium]|nr:hypothetical protein [bacterium]